VKWGTETLGHGACLLLEAVKSCVPGDDGILLVDFNPLLKDTERGTVCLSVCLSVCLRVCILDVCACVSVCLCVCLRTCIQAHIRLSLLMRLARARALAPSPSLSLSLPLSGRGEDVVQGGVKLVPLQLLTGRQPDSA